jgi:hypothetical protein
MQDQDHKNGPRQARRPDADNTPTEEGRSTSPGPVDQESLEPSEVEEGRQPIPVRTVMEGGNDEEKDRQAETRVVHDEEGGSDWVVTVSGRSSSGVLPLRTVPLMELNFAKAGEPEPPLRRALCCGGDLVDIPDHELLSLFRNSEPFSEPLQEVDGKGRPGKGGKNRRGIRD